MGHEASPRESDSTREGRSPSWPRDAASSRRRGVTPQGHQDPHARRGIGATALASDRLARDIPSGRKRPIEGPGHHQPDRSRGQAMHRGGWKMREGSTMGRERGATPRQASAPGGERSNRPGRTHQSPSVWTIEGAACVGIGTRPEQEGPEQGSGRPGEPGRPPSSEVGVRLPPVISGSSRAFDQALLISTPKGWSHPAWAGRGASPPRTDSNRAAPIPSRTRCLRDADLIEPPLYRGDRRLGQASPQDDP
jgi:hypothetical protein